ncbi:MULTISPECIES: LLM class flavin-dependent oxidoreductase [unclassified Campylobacter]|uniref:LLM class flavin-dependent oxidoreductase n=1 Tax=unclassified Campylobacter TaxID=2593542 RepID=UPI003D34BDDF
MKLSILNLAPLRKGQNQKDAIDALVRLAQHAENIGIKRYWIAEHHNMSNLASSATQLLIAHVLSQTSKICVGSGGVMLPNHSPYSIAEQYGTLQTLYPDRVELGLGRAPGTDSQTAKAIRRGGDIFGIYDFEAEISELRGYFDGTNAVKAYPANGLSVPFYILGSSTESAYLAAKLGLPYAFASHFAPRQLALAVSIYKQNFNPSKYLEKPYTIVGANVIIADTNEQATSLATTQTRFFLNVVTNSRDPLCPPARGDDEIFNSSKKAKNTPHFGPIRFQQDALKERERAVVEQMTACSFIGSAKSVRDELVEFHTKLGFDEIMAVSYIFDENLQFASYSALKQIIDEIKD